MRSVESSIEENVRFLDEVSERSISPHPKFDSYLREAFKRKNRKYIGLLPIRGGGYPPTNIFPVFS